MHSIRLLEKAHRPTPMNLQGVHKLLQCISWCDMMFRWTLKPEFGEVPEYLVKNKQKIAEEKANVENHIKLQQQQVSPS